MGWPDSHDRAHRGSFPSGLGVAMPFGTVVRDVYTDAERLHMFETLDVLLRDLWHRAGVYCFWEMGHRCVDLREGRLREGRWIDVRPTPWTTCAEAHRSPCCVSESAFHRPTGQCSIVMSSMGKSAGLPVAK
jgi:hypothetical protein